jgi:hypothetical protein
MPKGTPFKEIGGKAPVQSDFNMWGMEFERLQDVLKAATDGFIGVRGNPDMLLSLFDVLYELYKILRPLMLNADRAIKDKEFAALKGEVFAELNRKAGYVNFPGASYSIDEKIIEKLNSLHNALLDNRQVLGMGVTVRRKTSDKERLDAAVGGA